MNSSARKVLRALTPPYLRAVTDLPRKTASRARALLQALVPHDEKEERLLTAQAKKALAILECDSYDLGRLVARQKLHEPACERCQAIRAHLTEQLGSTLFIDDDPEQLLQAFAPEVRCNCALETLAACVLCLGRTREPATTVH